MITLTGQREIAGCQVYRDDVDPLAWYVMPQAPRIARDERGKPVLSLVWYRRQISGLTEEERKTRLGGGILSVSAELAATEAQLEEVRTAIANDPAAQARALRWWQGPFNRDPRKLAEALKIGTVPVKDGTVSIAVLAETPGAGAPGEFVANLVGVGRVSMVGRQRASFMAKLTQDGAVLLWQMLERDLAAIRVAYDIKFDHRLDAVRMSVWCDARKTYHALQDQWQSISDDASFRDTYSGSSSWHTFSRDQKISARDRVSAVAEASQTATIKIIPEAGSDVVSPELTQELTRSATEMIADFLAGTFLQWNPGAGFTAAEMPTLETELPEYAGKKYGHHGIEYYNLKQWDEEMQATLSYNFGTKAVVQGYLAPNDNLSGVLDGQRVDDFRTQIELDAEWYKYLDVEIVCTADFDDDPVDLVKAHLVYDEAGSEGRVHEVKDFVFKKDIPSQRFLAYLAAGDKRRYSYEYEVFYKGSDTTYKVLASTEETILVLDADRMGVLKVEVLLGLVDWDEIQSLFVKLWYGAGSGRQETEFTLNRDQQSFDWKAVIGREIDEPYHYQVTFIDKNNQRIQLAEETSRAARLVLNQPLQESLEVAIVPAGSFASQGGLIAKIVVALRYQDGDYKVDDLFTLANENDSKVWAVPLLHNHLREYEYQTTVFYSDGVTREDGWQRSDKSVLALGDPFGYRVQITPYLLKNRGYGFGILHLQFRDDPAEIVTEKTLEITDFTKPLYWRFRLGSPDRHSYGYQLTLFKETGEEVALPPQVADKEVLVLKPPAP